MYVCNVYVSTLASTNIKYWQPLLFEMQVWYKKKIVN